MTENETVVSFRTPTTEIDTVVAAWYKPFVPTQRGKTPMSFQCRICKTERQDFERPPRRRDRESDACQECLARRNKKRREAREFGLRWCSLCDTAKDTSQFGRNSEKHLSNYCRTCHAARLRTRKRIIRTSATTRTCPKCKKTKPLEEIRSNGSEKDTRCKECEAIRSAMGRRTNRTKFSTARGSAKRRGVEWTLTLEQYVALRQNACHYCGFPLPEAGGLDRIEGEKGYVLGNVIPCCTQCNIARGANFTVEEMLVIGEAIARVKAARGPAGDLPRGVRGWGRPKKYEYSLEDAAEQVPDPPAEVE